MAEDLTTLLSRKAVALKAATPTGDSTTLLTGFLNTVTGNANTLVANTKDLNSGTLVTLIQP